MAVARTTCPTRTSNSPIERRIWPVYKGAHERSGHSSFVKRHSTVADECAIKYMGQFEVNRNDSILASCVLYFAVVQNSRKWKRDRAAKKNGTRHNGEDEKRRIAATVVTDSASAMPRQNDRSAIPSNDLALPGKYNLSGDGRALMGLAIGGRSSASFSAGSY